MTKKETKEQAIKNKSILNWSRSIPEGMTETKKEKDIGSEGRTVNKIAETDIGPDGWKGTLDMPEVVNNNSSR